MTLDNRAILRAAVNTPTQHGWGLPMLIEGKPGSGKTSAVEAEADRMGMPIETIIASLREPQDFNGFPVPSGDSIKLIPPEWAKRLADANRGIAFFDELNTAAPSVQAALLRVVLSGVVGGFKLPGGIRFIAAQNSVEDAAGGWDLAPPMANRFGHLEWDAPRVDDWVTWLMGFDTDDDKFECSAADIEGGVMAKWGAEFAKAKGQVAGFLRCRPELMLQMPNSNSPDASKAWPSPRSWENATRAIASANIHGLSEESTDVFVGSFIGNGAAIEYQAWLNKADLPDPADVLDGKVSFQHDDFRLDRTAAVLSGCAALVVSCDDKKLQKSRADKLWSILTPLCTDYADLTIHAAQALVKKRLVSAASRAALATLQPVLQVSR